MALIATCIAVSLGELASAYPNSGGQYYWTARLAPKKYARFLSYSTGYLGWAGAVVVSGSVAVGLAQAVVGMIILANPNVLFYLESVPNGYRLACNRGKFSSPIRLSTLLPSGSTS